MIEGVIVGFDFGLKRLGVAIGNTLTKEARPLQIIDSRTNQSRWSGIEKVLKEWHPSALVAGVPRNPVGNAPAMTARCVGFARHLA